MISVKMKDSEYLDREMVAVERKRWQKRGWRLVGDSKSGFDTI